jgi:hypothetical protein
MKYIVLTVILMIMTLQCHAAESRFLRGAAPTGIAIVVKEDKDKDKVVVVEAEDREETVSFQNSLKIETRFLAV